MTTTATTAATESFKTMRLTTKRREQERARERESEGESETKR